MWPSRSTLTRATAVAVVLGALLVVGRLTGDSLRPPSPATTTRWHPPPVLPPPPTTPSPVTAHLRLGRVTAVAAERNAVWAAHGCAVSRVDPHTNRVVATIGLPPVRGGCWVAGMAAGTGALWVSQSSERLLRVDPHSRRVVATLALVGVGAPVVTDVGVWAECCWTGINTAHPTGSLVRIDPARNRQVRAVFEDAPSLVGESLVAAGGEVWATSGTTLLALGDTSRQVSLDELGGPDDSAPVSDLAASPDAVWVGMPAGLFRVDLARLG